MYLEGGAEQALIFTWLNCFQTTAVSFYMWTSVAGPGKTKINRLLHFQNFYEWNWTRRTEKTKTNHKKSVKRVVKTHMLRKSTALITVPVPGLSIKLCFCVVSLQLILGKQTFLYLNQRIFCVFSWITWFFFIHTFIHLCHDVQSALLNGWPNLPLKLLSALLLSNIHAFD